MATRDKFLTDPEVVAKLYGKGFMPDSKIDYDAGIFCTREQILYGHHKAICIRENHNHEETEQTSDERKSDP